MVSTPPKEIPPAYSPKSVEEAIASMAGPPPLPIFGAPGPEVPDFRPFPKMARLRRLCIVAEKIDGTNASIFIGPGGEFATGSRTRWITPSDDNFGFAKWAHLHREELVAGLGPGHHFGEWWGSGIQRGYGLEKGERRFSLFNTVRWHEAGSPARVWRLTPDNPKAEPRVTAPAPGCCRVVPILAVGEFCDATVICAEELLRLGGSRAASGFANPEGVVVYHVAPNTAFKWTFDGDGAKSNSGRKGNR